MQFTKWTWPIMLSIHFMVSLISKAEVTEAYKKPIWDLRLLDNPYFSYRKILMIVPIKIFIFKFDIPTYR